MKIEKNKIITFTGRQVDPFNLQPEDVNIVDIAHSLSQQNRYGGHTFKPYSVGFHCIMMERTIKNNNNLDINLDALMHDASEAYITDIPKPIKKRIPMIEEIEAKILDVIYQKYGIEHFLNVKEWDQQMVLSEIESFKMLNYLEDRIPEIVFLHTQNPNHIREIFLNRFNALTNGKFISETKPYQYLLVSR